MRRSRVATFRRTSIGSSPPTWFHQLILVGRQSSPNWRKPLRRTPEARWIGLAMPRFLLRLAYGERGTRCEALPFEELSHSPAHEDYLWGNPTLACLLVLVHAIAESGRPMYSGMNLEIGEL